MTRILRLLMIAAVALPMWQPAAAQKKAVPPKQKTETVVKADKAKIAECQESNAERSALDQRKTAKMAVKRKASKLAGNRATKQLELCNEGTTTQERVPIYCYWLDAANRGQMIYPADMLTDVVGAKITSITFHASSAISSTSGSTDAPVTLKIGTTTQTNFTSTSGFINVNSFTSSCTLSSIFNNEKEVTFDFTTQPLTYNGGNLLLDMSCEDVANKFGHVYWISKSVSNASLQQYSDYDATVQNYLPYITVTYQVTPTEPYLASLAGNGAFGEIYKGTTKSATITVLNEGTNAFTPKLASSEPAFTITGDMDSPLASDQSRDFTVTFTAAKAQEYTGTLTLSAPEDNNAILATVNLSGKGTTDVTIGDESATNSYAPVYGSYFDYGTATQMIYPSSMLSELNGKKIKAIKFYSNENIDGNLSTSTVTVSVGEVSGTTVSQSVNDMKDNRNNLTQVYEGHITSGISTWTIEFDTPYEYHGGNLMIDNVVTASSVYKSTYWYGTSAPNMSFGCYYNNYSGTSQSLINSDYTSFLPKITFEIEAGVSVDKKSLDFGTVAVNTTSAAQAVTVTNNTDDPVALSYQIDNNVFATSATATSVPAGGQVEIPVTFAPTAVGSQEGTLTINAGDETFNVALSGNALVAYAATLEPQTVDFGAVAMYNTQTATVTLTNTGANAITPTITQPSEPFSVTGDQTALASGETRIYTITFAPTAQETYSDEFTIADADHSISFTVTLTGQGAPMDPLTTNSPLNFGSVAANSSTTRTATFTNPNNTPITVELETAAPFSIPNGSSPLTIPANGSASVTVTFAPTDAASHTGSLTATYSGINTVVVLKGVGTMSGPEAIRDEAFFEGIPYTWTDSEGTHTSTLADIATKPEQIIAMIKEIYTNKDVPGNLKRGCTSSGNFTETWSDVSYPAIGTIEWVGPSDGYLNDLTNYAWADTYGWGINTSKDMIFTDHTESSYSDVYYTHFDQTEYQPNNEGVTLLLVEVTDDFDQDKYSYPSSTGAQYLKDLIGGVIKSVRVVTQAKRTGTGYSKGTLFNVDCDKMNKFYFMAKGQLRMPFNSMKAYHGTSSSSYIPSVTFSPYPMYVYCENYYGYGEVDGYADYYNAEPFYQMFEQFSPVSLNTGANIDDLYNSLTKMTSFNVIHDCITVPFATSQSEGDVHHGHQFMMYGVESGAADCQDVRDLMFFVPDYRMMNWDDRDGGLVYYTNYNQNHAPTMGLYVIIQDTVQAVTRADDYFKLKLTWDSNMDEFLPGEQQEYQLYQVFTDEFGVSKWVPVYKRNEQGQYWNPTTQAWQADTTGAEPVVLTLNPNDSKTYSEVYELRGNSSREVTYAIRGRDTGHFLSLQMSNEQSYVIPGKDPAEMVLMSSATIYSRYEAQNENNCYSNKIQMKAAPRTIKASYLPTGSTMTLNRSYAKVENGATVTVTEPIATLTINTSTKKFTVSGSVLNDVESLFPKGTQDGKTAGYHANNFTNNQISYTTQTISGTEYINFNLAIWDNFVVNVSKNEHPGLYTYQLRFNTAESFVGLNGSTNEAYSQPIRVYVYKTDSKVNSYTQTQVDDDATGALEVSKDIEFSAQVMLSSKGEILRYDAYRWKDGVNRSIVIDGGDTDEDEEDADPDGIAGNQGDSYSITMNAIGTSDYYVGDAVAVSTTNPQNWAKFVDYYPKTQPEAQAFVYAPVVELFTKGYQEGSTDKQRGDYNTYGGPLKVGTTGKLHVQVVTPEAEYNPLMSSYSWKDENQNKYAYYNIKLKMDIKKVPQGYEFYKIRAWRILDEGLQGEEYDELKDTQSPNCRVGEKVLFEDITYPDCSASDQYGGNLGQDDKSVTVVGADGQSHTYTSYTGTFGARKLRTVEGEQGVIDELPVTFVVRIYYTKSENLTNSQSVIGSKADGDVVTNPDAEFYAVDYTFTEIFTSEEDVPTAIQSIDASEVVSRKYYNVAGIESDTPFKGVNIVVTRYSDGSTTTTKILK